MRFFALLPLSAVFVLSPFVLGQDTNSTSGLSPAHSSAVAQSSAASAPNSFDQVIDRVAQREHYFNAQMRHLHPMVETYIQNFKGNAEAGVVPVSDQYFLGRLDVTDGTKDHSFMGEPGLGRKILSKLSSLYAMKFLPLGFAQMVILDQDFQLKYYKFTFVRRDFLGEVRCLMFDIEPKKGSGNGRFIGRIWVEDQDFNIVRFNGTYQSPSHSSYYLHFDSWRLNLRPGMWLPAYVYSEESGLHYGVAGNLNFKAQTRVWGYDLQNPGQSEEFTQILVDAPQTVRDQSTAGQDASPVESQRLWERQAEDNAVDRLQKIGLIAPEGEVDKVLQTVVNNLVVTNNLDIQPDVRARVLLTSPLESFTIGHTIVVSRGLLDVLPDEASLAMVMAHELSHIVLGHGGDTKLAFYDRMLFPDVDAFEQFDFTHTPAEENAADQKALDLLAHSPYKDKLANAGLFLKALQASAPELKNLIRPHLGNGLAYGQSVRMSTLLTSAPQLEARRTDQIAALPLGGRIRLDPWTSRVELLKTKPIALTSANEKLPFEVTPFFPYLTRLSTVGPEKVALTEPAK
jgi:peptidase M48-like protein